MLTLMEREFKDHIFYFVAAMIFSAVSIALFFTSTLRVLDEMVILLIIPMVAIVLLGVASMGAAQMHWDKSNKITSFLSTLAIGRTQILAAKCLVGVAAILLALLPMEIVGITMARRLFPPWMFSARVITEAGAVILLLTLNCYAVGLLTGWTTRKSLPALGCVVFPILLVCLVVIKGIGPEAIIVLGALLVASLTYTWVKFSSTPL